MAESSEIVPHLQKFLEAFGIELPPKIDPMSDEIVDAETRDLIRLHPTIRALINGDVTWKEALWVEYYITHGFDAGKAAKLAGYRSPQAAGPIVRQKKRVKLLMAARLEETVMDTDEILARYRDIANASFEDFFDVDEDSFSLNLAKAKKLGKMHLLKRVRLTRDGYEIQLHDQSHALDQLARHLNLFEKELNTIGNPMLVAISQMTSEERKQRLEELAALKASWQAEEGDEDGAEG